MPTSSNDQSVNTGTFPVLPTISRSQREWFGLGTPSADRVREGAEPS